MVGNGGELTVRTAGMFAELGQTRHPEPAQRRLIELTEEAQHFAF
ncbi:hypothetical protein L083_5628 [Actinoplanes sp. N902-109]|nr:hypothetical protein L083_5628 [Actinoplanes sp. N902-109]